ncbi:hypothetical protein BEH94_04435 [Candidatus Altiarchaeales archaeon WOR_SM1_SCG]|nr:hypothetical protein BEH94_04435 [Candidatus Altiarchaeales archaeon WOR_SM1_SCG]
MKKSLTIVIIGGYGGMGKLFAKLFLEEGHKIIVTGPTELKGRRVEKEMNVKYIKDNCKAAKSGDVVIVTVPIDYTIETIKEVAPCVKEGALLTDFTSVKEEPCRVMAEFSDKGVEVIGMHPMFGPKVPGLEGQVVVLAPVRPCGGKKYKWMSWLLKFLNKHKAKIIESTPEEHDRVISVVQGLTHFTYISVGKTLKDIDFDIKKSRRFASPIYELMLDMIGRIIGQDPHLYASIQMTNPRVIKVHEAFFKSAGELSETVKNQDREKFVEYMSDAAKHFDDVDAAMGKSNKAVASLVLELNQLKESAGKEIALRHIYSKNIHLGIVESVDSENVVINDSGKLNKLKISNIQILDDKEKIEFKIKKLGSVERDFSYIFDNLIDEKFLCELLKNFNENIISVKIKDVYSGKPIPEGKKSICFGVVVINENIARTGKIINKFLCGIGGKLR